MADPEEVFRDASSTLVEPFAYGDVDPVRQAEELLHLSEDFKEFKATYNIRKQQDSYRFAEIAENEDYKINLASSNRIMVNGECNFSMIVYWCIL